MRFLRNYIIYTGLLTCALHAQGQELYRDTSKTPGQRADDLLNRLTLTEKAMLLGYRNEAIERLNIPAYNWWSEGLHGVARAGEATVFPQAIGMAATFDPALVQQAGTVISTEARAKYNLASERGNRGMYVGLTYWSPNINIFRDPRWGRGQETYGEDPYLTSIMALAYVKGMQGNVPGKLKIAAAAKHFVAHSGPEATRDYFNAVVSESDLHNTYLYAFKRLAKGDVAGIMTAYNRVNGIPNSVNTALVRNTILNDWGYKGYIVTDCGALDDVFYTHKYLTDGVAAAAAAVKAGMNLDCSSVLRDDVIKAVEQKLITEQDVNSALKPVLLTQVKLGMYDNPALSPYKTYRDDSIHNANHVALARKAAQESMVLLKNDNNTLPLKAESIQSIMITGPNAASLDALAGSYHGVSSKMVNFAEGITGAVSKGTRVEYDLGAGAVDTTHFGGIWGAGNADVTIAVVGLLPVDEGEAGDAFLSAAGGDKKTLSLPASHVAFMRDLRKAVKKPIIAVVTAGSAVDIAAIAQYADAVILAWYPGEQGGNALADVVFGKVSPSGRLPVTFYNSADDLPAFDNYSMQGRTYRYFKARVQYPFGYGMSYTTFRYDAVPGTKKAYHEKETIEVTVDVTNTGSVTADEVIQAYIKYPANPALPVKELKQFVRASFKPGESITISMHIAVEELMKWDEKQHKQKLYPGTYTLYIGGNSDNEGVQYNFEVR
jgi:beta-glucosidase